MQFTLQTHFEGEWHYAATLELKDDTAGFKGASIVDYDLDYFIAAASAEFSAGKQVRDRRALSVGYPVDLENRYSRNWPSFLLDLMPQGHARRQLAEYLGRAESSRASDLPLLLRSATGGIGNIRIKEASDAEAERLRGVERQGVTEADILSRSDRFMEVADRFGMLASGSSGLQGEWPKVAMTQADDGLFYPDSFVTDDEAVRHIIVKLLRSNEPVDRLILEGEALYSRIAQDIGLHVSAPSTYAEGVLIIPRFDRKKQEDGGTIRLGQESFVSAIGVADFGHISTHEAYIDVLSRYSANPFADIVEYVKRDIANLALGNPDNHGRNSALSKLEDGTIRLSPLFDFAPMRLAREGIVRSTRWAMMRDLGLDHFPDWKRICLGLVSDREEQEALARALSEFAERLQQAPRMAKNMRAAPEILDHAMGRCTAIASSVLDACQSW